MNDAGRRSRHGDSEEANSTDKFSIGQRLSHVATPLRQPRRTRKKKAADALKATPPRIVVLGDPGGGKTTLLRWLATAFLMQHLKDAELKRLPDADSLPKVNWLPLLVRCRDLDKSRIADQQITIDGVLRQTFKRLEIHSDDVDALTGLFRAMLERGEVLLLLDGLDEITDPQLRSQFCRWIETVATQFPSPLVATSRIVGYREMNRRLKGRFEHATLADLSPLDKDEFIQRWCEVTINDRPRRESEIAKLKQAVHGRNSDRIERLTGNPMLLTTLALVQRKVGKLPSKRHKLYWEAVGVLLNWRSDVDEPLDPDEAIPQLEYVAFAMCDRGVQHLRRDELLELLDAVRLNYPNIRAMQNQSPADFLAQLERRTGLLVETGHEQHDGHPIPVYEFRHLTFQEYLAALAVVEGRFPGHDPKNSLAERVAPLAGRVVEVKDDYGEAELQVSENWREALRLCVACCNDDDVDSTLSAILAGPSELLETMINVSDAKRLSPEIPDDEQPSECLLDEREVRPRAILAALCLADEPNVSQATAIAVIHSFVSKVSERDGSGVVTTGVDRATMDLSHSVWSDSFRSMLLKEFQCRPPETRWRVGGLVSMISELTLPDSDEARKIWLHERVTQIVGDDVDQAQIAALAVMNAAYRQKAFVIDGLIDGLIAMISRGAASASAAVWALGWLSDIRKNKAIWTPTAAETALLKTHLADTSIDGWTAKWLCRVLGAVRATAAIPELLVTLEHSLPDARSAAVAALGEIAAPETASALKTCINDEDLFVRTCAIGAIAKICDDEMTKRLLNRHFGSEAEFGWIDPQDPIDDGHVGKAAEALELSETQVRKRYEAIAVEFGLTLSWQATA